MPFFLFRAVSHIDAYCVHGILKTVSASFRTRCLKCYEQRESDRWSRVIFNVCLKAEETHHQNNPCLFRIPSKFIPFSLCPQPQKGWESYLYHRWDSHPFWGTTWGYRTGVCTKVKKHKFNNFPILRRKTKYYYIELSLIQHSFCFHTI